MHENNQFQEKLASERGALIHTLLICSWILFQLVIFSTNWNVIKYKGQVLGPFQHDRVTTSRTRALLSFDERRGVYSTGQERFITPKENALSFTCQFTEEFCKIYVRVLAPTFLFQHADQRFQSLFLYNQKKVTLRQYAFTGYFCVFR